MLRRPLRVALVETRAANTGTRETCRLVAEGLEARGYEVTQIVLFRGPASVRGVRNARLVCHERPASLWGVLKFILRFRAELREARPDAVLSFRQDVNAIAAPVARSLGCRAVVANQVSAGAPVHPVLRWADALIGSLGLYSRIVVNSGETEAIYRRYWRPYRRRIRRIDHGVQDRTAAVPPSEARAALGLPQEVTLLGCASRLNAPKQLDCAIRLLAIRPDLHLAFAGQGTEKPRLESLVATLGLADRVHFVGELDTAEIGVFLAGLDVFLHPSRTETFGRAPAEAAQAGVPVVCNDLDVLRDRLSVEGQPCSLFADAPDPESLAGAVDRILTEPGLTDALRRNGRQLSARFPVDVMVDHYARLLEDAVGAAHGASPSRPIRVPSGAGTRLSVTD